MKSTAPAVVLTLCVCLTTAAAVGGSNSDVDDYQQAPVVVPIPDPVRACLPDYLHPVSRQYLDAFLLGHISRAQFLRGFPLPNSEYLPVEDCIIAAIDTLAEAELATPAAR
jgi:hypothetical protein